MSDKPSKKRFLSPEELTKAVEQVADIARLEGIKVLLIGGFAMQHYGSDRLTGDVDFASESLLTGLKVTRPLSFGGAQVTAPNGVPVDLVVRDDDYQALYEEALEHGVRTDVFPIPIAQPDYMAAMKMAAARDKDVTDLKFLLAEGVADLAKTRAIIRKHLGAYAAQEFDRIADEVQWEKQTGRR